MNNEISIGVGNGEFVIDHITENDRSLSFDPLLKITWDAYVDPHPAGNTTIIYISFDFGLTYEIKPYSAINCGWKYDGITIKTPLPDLAKSFVKYDLFHAFYHPHFDPNYDHLHWALAGWLKYRTTMKE